MAWSSSRRREQLPPDWPVLREHALRRDGYVCRRRGCGRRATDVDHVRRGNDHSLSNLQSLCASHHDEKTQSEAQSARRQMLAQARHPVEKHPGLRPRVNVKPQVGNLSAPT